MTNVRLHDTKRVISVITNVVSNIYNLSASGIIEST